ncbi:MAG: hypothetical protein ACO25B_06865 [Chitinophagaceae bacterium]
MITRILLPLAILTGTIFPDLLYGQIRPKLPPVKQSGTEKNSSTNCNSANMLFRGLKNARDYAQNKDFRNAKNYYETARDNSLPGVEKYCPEYLQQCKDDLAQTLSFFKEQGLDLETGYSAKELIEAYRYKYSDFRDRYCKSIGDNYLTDLADATLFLERAKSLDYVTVSGKLDEAGKKVPELADDFDFKLITGMSQQFSENLNRYQSEIRRVINLARTSRSKGPQEMRSAHRYARAASQVTEGILLLMPDNAAIVGLKGETDQLVADIGKEYEARVFTGPFHREHANQVVFSSQPVRVGSENTSQFKESFSAEDRLYAYCYFDGAISDVFGFNNKVVLEINVLLNGSHLWRLYFTLFKPEIEKTWFSTEIMPDPQTAMSPEDAVNWEKEILRRIPLGQHELTLQVEHNSRVVAQGKLQLNWDNYKEEQVRKNAEQACLNAENNLARTRQLPPEFSKPGGQFADPSMSVANIRRMILASPEFSDCVQILKLTLGTDQDWFLNKDGAIIQGRFNGRAVRVVYKSKDGWCYYIPNVTFNCTYMGYGKYGPPSPHIACRSKVKIACANVK